MDIPVFSVEKMKKQNRMSYMEQTKNSSLQARISLVNIQKQISPQPKKGSPVKIGPIIEQEDQSFDQDIKKKMQKFLLTKKLGIEKIRKDGSPTLKNKNLDQQEKIEPYKFSLTLIERLSKKDKVLFMFEQDRFKEIQNLVTKHSLEDIQHLCVHERKNLRQDSLNTEFSSS